MHKRYSLEQQLSSIQLQRQFLEDKLQVAEIEKKSIVEIIENEQKKNTIKRINKFYNN